MDIGVGTIIAALRMAGSVVRATARPHLVFDDPVIGSDNPRNELVIFHVDIKNKSRRAYKTRDAIQCSLEFEFEPVSTSGKRSFAGCWETDQGPVTRVDILLDDPIAKRLPVVFRANHMGTFRPGAVAVTVFPYKENVTHIFDETTLIRGQSDKILAPGSYNLTVTVREKGKAELAHRRYRVYAPFPSESNSLFTFIPIKNEQ